MNHRPMFFCRLNLVLLLASHLVAARHTRADDFTSFAADHCITCHNASDKQANLDLTALQRDLANTNNFALWEKIHDRIRNGEMPPEPGLRAAISADEQAQTLSSLATALIAADTARQQRDGRSGVRRLTRVEFENALRDLLHIPGLRVHDDLPADGKSHGFDRASSALDFSFVHQEAYLAAVDRALNEATPSFAERPPVFKARYKPWEPCHHEGRESEGSLFNLAGGNSIVPLIGTQRDPTFQLVPNAYARYDDGEPKAQAVGAYRHEDADFRYTLAALRPVISGPHRIRISAYSFGWDGDTHEPCATDRPGAIGLGRHSSGEHWSSRGIPANEPGVAEWNIWLPRQQEHIHGTDNYLRVIYASCEKVRYHNGSPEAKGPDHDAEGIAIEWIEMEGPVFDKWPPASQTALFGDLPIVEWTEQSGVPKPAQQEWPTGNSGDLFKDPYGDHGRNRAPVHVVSDAPANDARKLLAAFLPRAFRRPIADTELEHYAGIVDTAMNDGDIIRSRTGQSSDCTGNASEVWRLPLPGDFERLQGLHFQDAMKLAYRAALTSPDFLLIGSRHDNSLPAARLSAMLWSSAPDDELLALAERGELANADIRRAQAERMLADPKAERFIADFTGQWLKLRDINANPPDANLYPEFLPWLQESMLNESRAFFAELLHNNLGIVNLVRSDFAMLNEPLAKLYGIDGVSGADIRRVALPPDCPRGGLLTQAAVLKVSANGTTTSPVTRGAFVMDRILGIHPTPPPPDAGTIEPDTRGATTVREQLEKHKRNITCAGCHLKMDPYGFALESFDVIGGFRNNYRAIGDDVIRSDRRVAGNQVKYGNGPLVDCTGQMPDGRAFDDIRELRNLLATDEPTLARAFVNQLLTYATGAPPSFADRAEVDRIVISAASSKYGVRTLLLEVLASPLFVSP